MNPAAAGPAAAGPAGAGPAVTVREVTVHYGQVCALDRASLELFPGRVCAMVGVNGAGKSTLFKAIMGQVRLDTGSVRFASLSPTQARKLGAVSYVPQSQDIDWDFPLSVRDVVLTGRYGHMGIARRPRPADRAAVDNALERTGMSEYARRPIGQLSGGQRQRAFVARAIAQGARVLLLDEPFAGVDHTSVTTLTRLLRELAQGGSAVLVSTHDLAALPALADEAVLLQRRVLVRGTPAEVLRPGNLALAFGLELSEQTDQMARAL